MRSESLIYSTVLVIGQLCFAQDTLRYEPFTLLKRDSLVALFPFDEDGSNLVPFDAPLINNR